VLPVLAFGAPGGGAGVRVSSDLRGASSKVPAYGWHLVSLTCADSAAPISSSGGSGVLLTNAAAAKMRSLALYTTRLRVLAVVVAASRLPWRQGLLLRYT
jgi:hypothetical protein